MKKSTVTAVSILLALGMFYSFMLSTVGRTQNVDAAHFPALAPGETVYLGTAEPAESTATEGGNLFYAETAASEITGQTIQTSWWKARLSAYTSIGVASETPFP